MMIPSTQIAQLRCNVDLLELMGGGFRRVASSRGGEYAGPCPFCGGVDRCHVQPNALGGGRWFCRKCTGEPQTSGWRDIFDFVMRRDSCSFTEACAWLEHTGRAYVAPPRKNAIHVTTPGHCIRRQAQVGAFVASATARLLSSTDGEAGRAYLAGRGISLTSAATWQLGVAQVWHTQRRTSLPVITIPWLSEGRVLAVQYRFFAPGLLHSERYGQWPGGERLLCGLHLLRGGPTLVLVEGELNAVSIHQACPQVDVLSWGPQSNILRPCVMAQLKEVLRRGYTHILLWADEVAMAARAANAICGFMSDVEVVCVQPLESMDANDLLCRRELCSLLSSYFA